MPAPTSRLVSLAILVLPLAGALACAGAAYAAATPSPAAPKSRGAPVDVDAIVERAQDEARDALERAHEQAREAYERAQEALERRGDLARTAERDALLADLDYDLEWPTLAFIGSEFGTTREIVKNAPYSADAISESIQVLQDGNRIVKRSTTKLARDTYGRTRQEKEGPRGTAVYIFDPIDNRNYVLNTQRKVAVRIPRVPSVPVPPMSDLTGPLMAPIPPTPPTPPTPIAPAAPTPPAVPAVKAPTPPAAPLAPTPAALASSGNETERVVVRRSDGSARAEDVRVEVIRIGGRDADAMAHVAPLPPIAMPLLPQGKGERRSLGTRDFDGVKAEGTQTTHTIPAGEIGNEKPIVITSERWFSPELQLVVYARTHDPRSGETVYRLANLRRGEPSADLFRVPSDYRRRDSRG